MERGRINVNSERNTISCNEICISHKQSVSKHKTIHLAAELHYHLFLLYTRRLCTFLSLAQCLPKWKQNSNWTNKMQVCLYKKHNEVFAQASCPQLFQITFLRELSNCLMVLTLTPKNRPQQKWTKETNLWWWKIPCVIDD